MKKTEAQPAIRRLVHEWANATGFDRKSGEQPSFADFKTWLSEKHYAHYLLSFRSEGGAATNAEQWFDEELKQT
jgi:hypothetical protein